jgi:HEAT repeat protein
MVRDAQHMTSAFKMDQTAFDRWESSVPSDRFYDDFSLRFTPIDRDSVHTSCFYYSLTAESAQRTRPDIYSGRIRPTDAGGTSRYEKLRRYLTKAAAAHAEKEPIDQILFFSGNGFISESMVARIDEKATLLEHFPWLNRRQSGISYIDHRRDAHVKPRLINEMRRPDLDYAVLHHHGDWDTEYLNNLPLTNDTREQINQLKMFMRDQARHGAQKGMPLDTVYARITRRYDLPREWFEGHDDAALRAKDSIYLSDLDLYLSDFDSYDPQCRIVSLDACFNGSFHRDSCIANSYIFAPGRTIAVIANSVNVLQDKWTDRYIGLLGLGMNVGNIARYAPYLEQHIIGDPTFAFASADSKVDANKLLRTAKTSAWRKLASDDNPYAALQSMAIEQLFRAGQLTSDDLLQLFKTSPHYQVRMQTLINLSELRDDNFVTAVALGMDDSYEMVQRFAANWLARIGDDRLIAPLVSAAISNNTSERIEFAIKMAIPMYDEAKLMAELERQFPANTCYQDSAAVHKAISYAFCKNAHKWDDTVAGVSDPERSAKGRMQDIRTLRVYNVHQAVPQLLAYLRSTDDADVQQALLEALGWFSYSCNRGQIADVAQAMSTDASLTPAVRSEALKTYKRLTE